MTYLRVLVGRWSRRDWLAVLVIALTAALLVGATLVVVAGGAQTATLADEFDANASVSSYEFVEDAQAAAGPDAIVLPMATAVGPDEERHRVVGIPETSPSDVDFPTQSDTAVGPVTQTNQWRLEGTNSSMTVPVSPPETQSGILPSTWLRTTPETLAEIGPTEALVITPADDGASQGTPLVSALSFFVDGTDEVLSIVWAGIAAAGVIVAVTLSSVVRLTIRAREQAIRVIRATGAPPRRVRAALAARAGLLALTGGLLGYAIGVIVANAAVTVAVAVGLPTTLSVQVTTAVALFVGALLAVLTGLGIITGYVTARVATSMPPARIGHQSGGQNTIWWRSVCARLCPARFRRQLTPSVLPSRTILPTAATLATFAVVVLMVSSLGTVGASLSAGGATVTEPGVSHPLNSQIPMSYADGIEDDDIAASPEIVLLASDGDQPYLARGVEYESFAAVTEARLVDGTSPSTDSEAVIGVELAETLDIGPGDDLVIGGSTEPAVAQVTVVGTYETNGLADHQLLVSLPTARHLTSVDSSHVNLVRTNASDRSLIGDTESPTVIDIDAPSSVQANDSVTAEVSLWNPTDEPTEHSLTATLGTSQTTESVSLEANEQITVAIDLEAPSPGEYNLVVDGIEQSVTVTEMASLKFVSLPEDAPPNTSVRVQVVESTDSPVANATISLANQTVETNADGTAWLDTPAADGTYQVTAQTDNRELNQSIRVSDATEPAAVLDVTLSPGTPTIYTQPTLKVQLTNPWQQSIETAVAIDGPGTDHREDISLEPGETTTVTTTLSQQPPGEYAVDVTAGDGQATSYDYQVTGDDRLTSALAASGHYGGGGGLGGAIEYAIGNLHVLLATLVSLAAVTVVGATSAVLARAVSTRRRTLAIYRATGASPWRLLARIVCDAARIGLVASVGGFLTALMALEGLSMAGYLTAFGISLDPLPSVSVALGVLGGGIALTCIAAVVATIPVIRSPPAALLAGSQATPPSQNSGLESSAVDHSNQELNVEEMSTGTPVSEDA